ncbi:MAG: DNA internalization-related competence protein ComEC/Rec2 [Thiobacillus sp.]|nr:DNA internalization-related competence protein ComEC/Rec2 [Thiobacillus sp.]
MRFHLIAFCLGIFLLQLQASLPPARALALLPLLALVFLLPTGTAWQRLARAAGVAVFAAALGFAWAAWRADVRLAERLPLHWQGVDIGLVGVVVDLPQSSARGERVLLKVERVLTPGVPNPGRVQLTRYVARDGRRPPAFRAGERWQLTARLKRPSGTHNPHGFDLEAWMLERGIGATGYVRETPVPVRLDSRAATPAAWIAVARQAIRDRIFATLGDAPYAGVIAALTVGDQQSIPHVQWRAFTRTGVNHLLSISGLHVTMIAALGGWGVMMIWRRWPRAVARWPARQAGLVAAVGAAIAYALLAGFQVPAQRTLFMLMVLAAAFWGRREARPFSALIMAMAGVLLIDPWAVLSAGFWLSFGAIAAILWVTFGRVAAPHKLRGWVMAQAAVTLALAPALWALFQQVSLISPLANAVAIPLVSWGVTPLALLGVLVPQLWHLAAGLMAWLGEALLWASALPWATLSRPAPGALATGLALAGAVWMLMPRAFPLRGLAWLLWLPLLWPPQARLAWGEFAVEVIDVGQGTSVLVRTARHALLYDTGPAFAGTDAGERIVAPYLRASGVGRLDGVIVSHDDNDHSGGLASVLRDVPTGWLLHALPVGSAHLSAAPAPRRCWRGQRWQWDGIDFDILNPPAHAWQEAGSARRDNDFSCVLRVSRGAQSFLITGDAERRGELELLESGQSLAAAVLVAGHHGSRTSSLDEFVKQVSPGWVVYTMGYRNRFGHPHAEVVARFREAGSVQLRSDRDGLVRFRFGEGGVDVAQYRRVQRRYWQTAYDHE